MGGVCAIVGAGEGLGRALAIKFSDEGFDVALLSRSPASCTGIMEEIRSRRRRATVKFFPVDASHPKDMESALLTVSQVMGEIDVLIYNVRGEFARCAPLEMSYELLEDSLRLEVVGAFAAAKAVIPSMIQRGRGSVFFSSATAAFRGSSTYPHYAIGKFGMRGLSQSLAKA